MNSYRSKQPSKQGMKLNHHNFIDYQKATSSEKIKKTHNFIPQKYDSNQVKDMPLSPNTRVLNTQPHNPSSILNQTAPLKFTSEKVTAFE